MRKIILALMILFCLPGVNAQQMVEVPDGVKIETWNVSAVFRTDGTENVAEAMQVAFDGTDVYFNFPNPINGNSWIKGVLSGNKATFANAQYIGTWNGTKFYLFGMNEKGWDDITFDYDEEKGTFSTLDYIALRDETDLTTTSHWGYFENILIYSSNDTNADGTVTPPAGVTLEDWSMAYRSINPNNESQYVDDTETIKVGIAGDVVYIQGLCGYISDAWVKGVISGSTVTVSKRQLFGSYNGTPLYIMGYSGNGEEDVVFDYDADNGKLTARNYILNITEDGVMYVVLSNVVITKSGSGGDKPLPETPVTPPSNINPVEYSFKATQIIYNQDGSVASMEPVMFNVNVGFNGSTEVYIQGVYRDMPDGWIKGTIDDGIVTFAQGQYMGRTMTKSDIYYTGLFVSSMSDGQMTWDNTNKTFSGGSYYVCINSSKTTLAPYEVFAGVTITRIPDVEAVPANPELVNYIPYNAEWYYGYANVHLPTQDVSGNPLLKSKLHYRIWYLDDNGNPAKFVFSKVMYRNLPQVSMDKIPYSFNDNLDFFYFGEQTSFNIFEEWIPRTAMGVQSVYTGGGSENASEIVWYQLTNTDTGIEKTVVSGKVESEVYYDLQGRRVSPTHKGIVIKTQVMSDGSHRTTKIINR